MTKKKTDGEKTRAKYQYPDSEKLKTLLEKNELLREEILSIPDSPMKISLLSHVNEIGKNINSRMESIEKKEAIEAIRAKYDKK